jgi:hypothetical protein
LLIRFASQRRAPIGRCVKNKKANAEYPFGHGEVINYTLDGVSIHPVTIGIFPNFQRMETHIRTKDSSTTL